MDDKFIATLILIASLCIGMLAGVLLGQSNQESRIAESCLQHGSFTHEQQLYICKPTAQWSQGDHP